MYFQVLSVNSLALRITTDIQKGMSAHLINADLAVVAWRARRRLYFPDYE